MAASWLRVPRTFLARASGSRIPQLATFVFAEQHAGTRTYHLHRQWQQQPPSVKYAIYTTCVVTGFGYVLYKGRDLVQGSPSAHAISSPPSDINQNRDKYNFIADVVEISAPAVVCIEIREGKSIDLTGKLRTIATSNGSGFIISEDGLILTNAHVVINKPNTPVKVRLYDGSTYTGVIEDIDLQSDLATLRINKTNLPVMKLGSSDNIRSGEFVVAIGSPLTLSNTITSGVVSSVNRQSQELGFLNKQRVQGYIQTDAAITFGNSGGPLVNLNGEAIGINAMTVTPGISFAIPIDHAKEFLKEVALRKKNKDITFKEGPKRRYMGITMQTLTPEILHEMQQYNEYKDVEHGVIVWRIMLGSPAHSAGLQPGDVVTHANDEPVLDSNNIYKKLEQAGIIKLQVLRKGQILHKKINPEDI